MAQRLISAAQSGDITIVRRLVEGETDVNATDSNGKTALHYAAEKNQGAIVDYLLDKGANVNKQDNEGQAALQWAAWKGHVNISKSLLAKGADINMCSNTGNTALHFACGYGHLNVVQYLISEGADIHKTSKAGFTPLHFACQEGHIQIADCLLSRGVDVNTATHDGRTPLHVAAGTSTGGGHLDMVKFMVTRGASINQRESRGGTALKIASQYGHIDIVRYLIDAGAEFKEGDNKGWTPLHAACADGHLHVVQLLVSLGADINKVKNDGMTPLHVAARHGQLDSVKYLISEGALVKKHDNLGYTALHEASEDGHSHVVDFLLQDKSQGRPMINQTNKAGYTSLHLATQGGHTPVVDVLLSHGADINFLTAEGQNCLHLAAELCNKPDVTVEMTPSLKQIASSLPPSPTRDGQALFLYLVQRGADINIKTKGFFRRKTPLDCISESKLRTTLSRAIPTLGKWVAPATPLEILARGPEAVKAYTEALRTGEKRIYRTRLMLVGQERVGKTSLKKALTGQKFDPEEPITHGVECKISVDVAHVNADFWSIQGDPEEHAQKRAKDYTRIIAGLVVDKLKDLTVRDTSGTSDERPSPEKHLKSVSPQREVSYSGPGATPQAIIAPSAPLDDSRNQHGLRIPLTGRAILTEHAASPLTSEQAERHVQQDRASHQKEEMLPEISELVKKEVQSSPTHVDTSTKEEEPISFHIWDFAGHELYYITHQVFLSWRAIYLVEFDLSKDLDAKVGDGISSKAKKAMGGAQTDLTNLEFIYFWISSIIAHASPPPGVKSGAFFPRIFIVGTHRDSIPNLTQPVDEYIQSVFDRIKEGIAGKPFHQHVVRPYYAIENKRGANDQKLKDLQAHILRVASKEPYWGEKIPLRWLKFEDSKDATKQPVLKINQIKEIAKPLHIDDDLETMLTFYHDLGKIVYFGSLSREKRVLNDLVILDPQWLVDVFKEIITIDDKRQTDPHFYDLWDKLQGKGILEGQLINHVWKRFALEDRERLLDVMEQFDLICAAPGDGRKLERLALGYTEHETEATFPTNQLSYYVPSLFNPKDVKADPNMATWASLTFYVDFNGLFTIGLFHRLMSRIAQQVGRKVELYYRQIYFPAAENHWVLIEMIPHPEALVKVTVYKVVVVGERTHSSESTKLNPVVCKTIREAFCRTLDDMCRDWIGRTLPYEIQFECLLPTCIRRYPLELCNNMEKSHECMMHAINLNVVREMFGIYSHVLVLTHEGGRITFQSLGVEIEVPANAVGPTTPQETQHIKIEIITDVAKYIPTRDEELHVAFGIQCLPDGLQLNAPIKVNIPHCVSLLQTDEITPILYSGHGEIGTNLTRQILPSGQLPAYVVQVLANELHLRLDHFSWHIVAFIRGLFTRNISVACYTMLPTCMPKGRKITMYVYMYKARRGMTYVMERLEPLGYVSAHPENKFPVPPSDTSDFFLECTAQHEGNKQVLKDAVAYDSVMGLEKVRRSFEFDFTGCSSNEVNFTIEVIQEDSPDTVGTKIKLTAKFDATLI